MYLGIEIGGTKLQLAAGTGCGGQLTTLRRADVDPTAGAAGIRQQIQQMGTELIQQHNIQQIGIGFGGPVDTRTGTVIRSFQIDGWDRFPLGKWCQQVLGVPGVLENDSNLAGLGEARFGAGRGHQVVVYSNVGSGIGGALVIDGRLYLGGAHTAVTEIGHLRPGPEAITPEHTVESLASGWGLATQARRQLGQIPPDQPPAAQLLERAQGDPNRLTGKIVVQAAADGNPLATRLLETAIRTYGWALAQVITLTAPNVLVIGGGVSLVGEELFFAPLRKQVARYVMPPLRECYKLLPAALGDEVVVHGALALAADHHRD